MNHQRAWGAAMSGAPLFGKVVVFGVGLIGGSFALALKAAGQAGEIVGFGRTLGSLNQALQLGILDRVGFNVGQEVSNADLVLIATPVGKTAEIMARIAPCLGSQTVVTDGGSTKEDVVAAARMHFGERIGQFVPAHPIAGAENSGALAARADLYREKAGGADAIAGKRSAARGPRTFGLGVLRWLGQGVDCSRA
jgi:prephenate dehydrogenase